MLKASPSRRIWAATTTRRCACRSSAASSRTSIEDAGRPVRPGIVFKAALLAKTDLTTELVKEFTELQGIIGGLYAKVQELDPP